MVPVRGPGGDREGPGAKSRRLRIGRGRERKREASGRSRGGSREGVREKAREGRAKGEGG